MIKVATIIGARPQIIKAAAISRAINTLFRDCIAEVIIHTGQHYDEEMSEVFFKELGIPRPHYNLNTRSASPAQQVSQMMNGIEEILLKEKPQAVILYGDTNSTLAGSLTSSGLNIPVIHIEAGLRSYNKSMPEEINRIVCDHVSTLLFVPTRQGVENLMKEGFSAQALPPFNKNQPGVFHCGDIMYDNSLYFSSLSGKRTTIIERMQLEEGKYVLSTIHRGYNTDVPERLSSLFRALCGIASETNTKILLPLHPRTSKMMESSLEKDLLQRIRENPLIIITKPVSFLEMIELEKNAMLIMTDSGGVQKEAYFFGKPCIILRSETEWVELVENGNAVIADADERKIMEAFKHFRNIKGLGYPPIYGDGHAAEFICNEIVRNFSGKP